MSLKDVSASARKRVKDFFHDYNFQELSKEQFPAKDVISAWKGTIMCEGEAIGIIVALPHIFPDELPKIYLTENFKHYLIPHVDDKNFVCTFDADSVDFFSENVEGLLRKAIEKARTVIADGISGRNKNDFEEEFLAYWSIGSENTKIYSLFEPKNEICEVQIATIASGIKPITYIVGKDKEEIETYIRHLDNHAKITELQTGLYFSLSIVPIPPFPTDTKEIFSFLKQCKPAYEQAVFNFIKNHNYQGVIIFSIMLNNTQVLASWKHTPPEKKLNIHGYRPGKISDSTLKRHLSTQKIIKFSVERLDSNRIQNRIGNDNKLMRQKKVCILGCGSIGGQIAFLLAKSGIEQFILIDHDVLLPENISRHLCGMSEIGQNKVDTISKRLTSHFPHIHIDVAPKKFHEAFTETPEHFYDASLIISATGNTVLERRLNQIQLDSNDFPPILYSWIEPYGIASHAIIILKGQGGCFQCCLNQKTLRCIFSVANFKTNKTIREAGCQTTFTPYSAIEADQASSLATRLALAYLHGEVLQSTRFIWLGDLSIIERINVTMNPLYQNMSPFSFHSFKIERQKDCIHCNL